MQTYICAWHPPSQYVYDVEGDDEYAAKTAFIELIRESIRDDIEVYELSTYDVVLNYSGCRVNVLAPHRTAAEESARNYVERMWNKLKDEVRHTELDGFVMDLDRTVNVKGESDASHFEIVNGRWWEGSLNDVDQEIIAELRQSDAI